MIAHTRFNVEDELRFFERTDHGLERIRGIVRRISIEAYDEDGDCYIYYEIEPTDRGDTSWIEVEESNIIDYTEQQEAESESIVNQLVRSCSVVVLGLVVEQLVNYLLGLNDIVGDICPLQVKPRKPNGK